MWKFLRKVLFLLNPELAHHVGTIFLRVLGFFGQGQMLRQPRLLRSHTLAGMPLDSPLGIAAGFDKDGKYILGLRSLGFGFVEVGSVTLRPQPGNPKPRVFRVSEAGALINRMGFNSEGAPAVAERLSRLRALHALQFPIGVNLGKNRETPLERAGEEYAQTLEIVYGVADYVVVNLSSPNTPGLTSLQEGDLLGPLLSKVRDTSDRLSRKLSGPVRPLLLKLSPDLTWDATKLAIQLALEKGFSGVIAFNTSRRRDLPGLEQVKDKEILKEEGGLSGRPLRHLACENIAEIRKLLGPKPTLISVGGLCDGKDAAERLQAGANLLQVYTGFIYEGPSLPARINKAISKS